VPRKETPVSEKRLFWWKIDTCVAVETLFAGKRHLCWTFEGEKTLFKERRHFWWKRYTCVGVETLWMKRDTFTT